jgi:hypothetical protein
MKVENYMARYMLLYNNCLKKSLQDHGGFDNLIPTEYGYISDECDEISA